MGFEFGSLMKWVHDLVGNRANVTGVGSILIQLWCVYMVPRIHVGILDRRYDVKLLINVEFYQHRLIYIIHTIHYAFTIHVK